MADRAGGEEATECIAEFLWQHTCMLSKSVFDGPERGRHVRLVVLHHPPVSGRLPDLANCEQKVVSMQGFPSTRARASRRWAGVTGHICLVRDLVPFMETYHTDPRPLYGETDPTNRFSHV